MNIPKGYKLVPVETTEEMNESGCQGYMAADGSAWVMHKSSMEAAYKAMLAAAPAPPQPIYDEAAEQEAFEAVNPMPDQVTKFKGGYAPTGYSAWDAQDFCKKWDGWKSCAQSRAKSVEVGHE